jgi:glycosyltransferase involved in cell wall biosynthesis
MMTTSESPALSVVIPVYNEGENVVSTLRGLAGAVHVQPLEILVVYDFDADTTVPVVERLRGEIPGLRPFKNELGKGVVNALKAGLRAAAAPYVLVTMADASDDPASVDAMYARAAAGADVVSGSRYMRGGRQLGGPLLKRTMSRVAGLSLHWVGGVPTHDPTNSFRMYSRRLLDAVELESEGGFEVGIELTVKAHLLGMRVDEVPTTWRDRTAGESRFKVRQWTPHYLRWYLRGIGGRLRRRPRV